MLVILALCLQRLVALETMLFASHLETLSEQFMMEELAIQYSPIKNSTKHPKIPYRQDYRMLYFKQVCPNPVLFDQKESVQMNRRFLIPFVSVAIYLGLYALIALLKPPSQDHIRSLHEKVSPILHSLMNTSAVSLVPLHSHIDTQPDHPNLMHAGSSKHRSIVSREDIQDGIDWNLQDPESGRLVLQQTDTHQWYRTSQPQSSKLDLQVCLPPICSSLKSKKSDENVACSILRGILTDLQLSMQPQSVSAQNKAKSLNISDWNGLFLVYAITAQAIKQIIPANVTVVSSSSGVSLPLSSLFSSLKRALDNSDIHHYVNTLKPIGDQQIILNNITSLAQQIADKNNLADRTVLSDKLLSFQLALMMTLEMNKSLTPQQLAGIIRYWGQTGQSIEVFYREVRRETELEHMKSWFQEGKMYYYLLGAGIVMVYLMCQIDPKAKAKRQFRHVFPPAGFKVE